MTSAMKRTVIFMMLAFYANIAQAQLFSISGLNIGADMGVIYTDSQIRAALGTPTEYKTQNDEFGGTREYQFGTSPNYDIVRWQGGKSIVELSLRRNIFTMTFSGGRALKVGENISKLATGILQYIGIQNNDKYYRYCPETIFGEEFVGILTDNNGVIKYLYYSWIN